MERLGADKEKFLKGLSVLRAGKRVTTDTPEATYDALNKYGIDLVEKARSERYVGIREYMDGDNAPDEDLH